jgi:Aspartyl protease
VTIIRFNYKNSQGQLEPIIPIGISLGGVWRGLNFYVDSGATFTIIQAKFAKKVGFDYETGEVINIQVGNGASIKVFLHSLEVQLGNERLVSPIGFSNQLGVNFNVLGKVGFFDRFKVCFQESQQLLTFERVDLE